MADVPHIVEAQIWPLRAQLHAPIRTAFGAMVTRPALLLQLIDADGTEGWGECWVNFPAWAVEERTILLSALLRDVVGQPAETSLAPRVFACHRMTAIQSGAIGPLAQAVSAIDLALWDLFARRIGVPVRTLLAAAASGTAESTPAGDVERPVAVYASGIGPEAVVQRVEAAQAAGFRDAKIKVGFDTARDRGNFAEAARLLGSGHVLVDANQGWSRAEAAEHTRYFEAQEAYWIEEPLSALDAAGYVALTQQCRRVAAGENWHPDLLEPLAGVRLRALQPDLCKAGGISGARRVIDHPSIHAETVAFHVLGSPLCHAAALQVAAAWPDRVTWVEMDTNENPLVAAFRMPWMIQAGQAVLDHTPGWGVTIDCDQFAHYRIAELAPLCRVGLA